MVATTCNGRIFLTFLALNEREISNYQPLAGSYAVLKCDGRYLLCYNTWRKQWELPAGQREQGETPKECAIRELYEETGQQVMDLQFKRLLKVKHIATGEIKYNPIYFAAVEKIQPFIENEETSAIMLWDLHEDIGVMDPVDVKVFEYM